jgi:hypothetical protein
MGALDVVALADAPSPSCLLHWHAMRDFRRLGVRDYNLGSGGSGGLMIFKNKFRPVRRDFCPPLTVILQPARYRWIQRLLAVPRFLRYLGGEALLREAKPEPPPLGRLAVRRAGPCQELSTPLVRSG